MPRDDHDIIRLHILACCIDAAMEQMDCEFGWYGLAPANIDPLALWREYRDLIEKGKP